MAMSIRVSVQQKNSTHVRHTLRRICTDAQTKEKQSRQRSRGTERTIQKRAILKAGQKGVQGINKRQLRKLTCRCSSSCTSRPCACLSEKSNIVHPCCWISCNTCVVRVCRNIRISTSLSQGLVDSSFFYHSLPLVLPAFLLAPHPCLLASDLKACIRVADDEQVVTGACVFTVRGVLVNEACCPCLTSVHITRDRNKIKSESLSLCACSNIACM